MYRCQAVNRLVVMQASGSCQAIVILPFIAKPMGLKDFLVVLPTKSMIEQRFNSVMKYLIKKMFIVSNCNPSMYHLYLWIKSYARYLDKIQKFWPWCCGAASNWESAFFAGTAGLLTSLSAKAALLSCLRATHISYVFKFVLKFQL